MENNKNVSRDLKQYKLTFYMEKEFLDQFGSIIP